MGKRKSGSSPFFSSSPLAETKFSPLVTNFAFGHAPLNTSFISTFAMSPSLLSNALHATVCLRLLYQNHHPGGEKITCSDLASPAEWVFPLLLTSLKSVFKSQPPSPHSREPSASGSRPHCPASPGSPEQSHQIQSFSLSLRSHSSPGLVSLDTRLAQSSYLCGRCSFSTMCTYH